jgi:2-polyprenyl-3-methyl-5-hydroxy-6-metoxy-1,4-benzoquinol methylase
MGTMATNNSARTLRVLVAIASYGTSNDRYLEQVIREYTSMAFTIDIVVLSNIQKRLGSRIECRVGLPAKDPWSLPFGHKKVFNERRDDYDIFIYSEDDILITERSLRAWMEVNAALADDEVPGFLRVEFGPWGHFNFPDAHAHFHWDPSSVRRRGQFTLACFTNEHAACYVLTRAQLNKAIKSGGFDVPPHQGKYDLLCTAATDVYTQCGLEKLIPISHIDDFTVHHMSNKYVGRMGLDGTEFGKQIEELLRIERAAKRSTILIDTETKLWRGLYSKDYYEPVQPEVVSLIPTSVRRVLSIGCGLGATEISLAKSGLSVTAVPLDTVISCGAAQAGVEIIEGDFQSAGSLLRGRRFDCLLLLNLLHLAPDPGGLLSLYSELLSPAAPIIIQSPNMSNLPAIWRQIRDRRMAIPLGYERSGAHFSSWGRVQNWCRRAGLNIERAVEVLHRRVQAYNSMIPALAKRAFTSDIIAVARRLDAPGLDT